jgi:hypothetical protein
MAKRSPFLLLGFPIFLLEPRNNKQYFLVETSLTLRSMLYPFHSQAKGEHVFDITSNNTLSSGFLSSSGIRLCNSFVSRNDGRQSELACHDWTEEVIEAFCTQNSARASFSSKEYKSISSGSFQLFLVINFLTIKSRAQSASGDPPFMHLDSCQQQSVHHHPMTPPPRSALPSGIADPVPRLTDQAPSLPPLVLFVVSNVRPAARLTCL